MSQLTLEPNAVKKNDNGQPIIESSRELKPVESKTDAVAAKAIEKTEFAHPADKIDAVVVDDAPAVSERVEQAVKKTPVVEAKPTIEIEKPADGVIAALPAESKKKPAEANPGLEAVNAALSYERMAILQLQGTEKESSRHLQTIDLLLDLSSAFSALPDREKHEISEEMQSILGKLKENGVDLLKGDPKEITKEQWIEVKSAIGSHIDKSRTKVQQIFTKMQNIIQNMMSVNDSGKRFVSEFTQMIRTIIRNSRAGG
jgi:hypothetical protein